MITVKCVCGYEILIIPDIWAMKRAIKYHSKKHPTFQRDVIEGYLTREVLKKVGDLKE